MAQEQKRRLNMIDFVLIIAIIAAVAAIIFRVILQPGAQAPAYFKGTDREGNPVYTEMEDYSILYVTIEADALQSSAGYDVGGCTIHGGDTLTVQFPGLYCEAQCISINVLE